MIATGVAATSSASSAQQRLLPQLAPQKSAGPILLPLLRPSESVTRVGSSGDKLRAQFISTSSWSRKLNNLRMRPLLLRLRSSAPVPPRSARQRRPRPARERPRRRRPPSTPTTALAAPSLAGQRSRCRSTPGYLDHSQPQVRVSLHRHWSPPFAGRSYLDCAVVGVWWPEEARERRAWMVGGFATDALRMRRSVCASGHAGPDTQAAPTEQRPSGGISASLAPEGQDLWSRIRPLIGRPLRRASGTATGSRTVNVEPWP